MSQALMKISVQVVALEAILLDQRTLSVAPDKLLAKAIALSRLVVSLRNVFDGYGFRTMIPTDPIGVRQVDTDG